MERAAQPVRLQALFEGAASGAPVLGREGSPTAQPVSSLPQEDDDMARDFDLFGPGPEPSVPVASAGIVQDTSAQSPSVEERMNQLTSVVQELARLVTTGVATQSAQPQEGAAQGAPAASSSDALGSYKPGGPQIPLLAAHAGSGPPPDSPSSSSSGSSSSSDGDKPACRMCGSTKHHEKDYPKLAANRRGKKGDPPGSSPGGGRGSSRTGSNAGSHRDVATGSTTAEKTFAETEEETIRLKSLSDLTFPSPPENAARAQGYVNQVLMAIGKSQRTAGDKVYIWAQECMTLSDTQLKADLRFPRLNREIAAKLIRACRKGQFGLLFQQQVEQERSRSWGMPNGRCRLRAIFRHFQLECDRIGMLAERNLVSTRLAGGSLQDLEDVRDKYLYVLTTILPKPSTMFNHLIDELDKCPSLKQKVKKARESRPGSHRRTTEWLLNRGHCP